MSDATGADDDGTPDETFGRFVADPILGELFVPIGDLPDDDAAEDADDSDAEASGADADADADPSAD